jgi:hypothetical protein
MPVPGMHWRVAEHQPQPCIDAHVRHEEPAAQFAFEERKKKKKKKKIFSFR